MDAVASPRRVRCTRVESDCYGRSVYLLSEVIAHLLFSLVQARFMVITLPSFYYGTLFAWYVAEPAQFSRVTQ